MDLQPRSQRLVGIHELLQVGQQDDRDTKGSVGAHLVAELLGQIDIGLRETVVAEQCGIQHHGDDTTVAGSQTLG